MIKRAVFAALLGLCVVSNSESLAPVQAIEIEDLGEPDVHQGEPVM